MKRTDDDDGSGVAQQLESTGLDRAGVVLGDEGRAPESCERVSGLVPFSALGRR